MMTHSGIIEIDGNIVLWGIGSTGYRLIKQSRDGEIIEETVHYGKGKQEGFDISTIRRYQTIELFNAKLKSTKSTDKPLIQVISLDNFVWYVRNFIIMNEFYSQREAFAYLEYKDIHDIPENLLEIISTPRDYLFWEQLESIHTELQAIFNHRSVEHERIPQLSDNLSSYMLNDLDRVW